MEVCPVSKCRKRTPCCCHIFQKGPSAALSAVDARERGGCRGPSKEPVRAGEVEGRGQSGQHAVKEGGGGEPCRGGLSRRGCFFSP